MHANRKLPLDVKQDQHSRAAAHWQVSPSEEGRHLLLYFLMVSCGTNGGSRARFYSLSNAVSTVPQMTRVGGLIVRFAGSVDGMPELK
eukprot:SAG25_NODE_3112_length_1213_cov_1.106822_1_plen_88_part_00